MKYNKKELDARMRLIKYIRSNIMRYKSRMGNSANEEFVHDILTTLLKYDYELASMGIVDIEYHLTDGTERTFVKSAISKED